METDAPTYGVLRSNRVCIRQRFFDEFQVSKTGQLRRCLSSKAIQADCSEIPINSTAPLKTRAMQARLTASMAKLIADIPAPATFRASALHVLTHAPFKLTGAGISFKGSRVQATL